MCTGRNILRMLFLGSRSKRPPIGQVDTKERPKRNWLEPRYPSRLCLQTITYLQARTARTLDRGNRGEEAYNWCALEKGGVCACVALRFVLVSAGIGHTSFSRVDMSRTAPPPFFFGIRGSCRETPADRYFSLKKCTSRALTCACTISMEWQECNAILCPVPCHRLGAVFLYCRSAATCAGSVPT